MKKRFTFMLLFLAALLIVPSLTLADSVTTTAVYSSDTDTTAFSAPDASITISFNIPGTLDSSRAATLPVTIDFMGTSTTRTGSVIFYPTAQGGLFDLMWDRVSSPYNWLMFGPQVFDSSNTLIPGTYPINTSASDFITIDGSLLMGTFTSGTVTIGATEVPEPSGLLFLAIGLGALAPFARRLRVVRFPNSN